MSTAPAASANASTAGTNDPTARRMVEQHDPDAALTAALQRLENSRLGLRQVMIPPPRRTRAQRAADAQGEGGAADAGFWQFVPDAVRDGIDTVARLLRKHPVSSLVADAVTDWWQRHPVRAAASVAGSEVAQAAGPLIRRYPVAAVVIAGVAGAALVASRPWRWHRFGGGTSRPVHRRVASWLMAQVPLQAALGTLIALLADQARQAASRPRPEAPAAESGSAASPPA